ncbi:unnamed protein product [Ambrosiozyma monospora]|uniref:Unnamed protein product n=1 Tax=Ambrosiozyma monospora TaxID=43982 RepID=A0A9W6YR76_AMBMO|nr:unnamed protein product [Ambrosiozyma monospora]
MNSISEEADSLANTNSLELLPDIEAGGGTNTTTLSEYAKKLDDEEVDICIDLLLREVEKSKWKETEKDLPTALKIIIVITILMSLFTDVALLIVILAHSYPFSPSILSLADVPDDYLKNVPVAPGMVFVGFGFLGIDLDSLFLQCSALGNLAYGLMYSINVLYLSSLVSSILIGAGVSPRTSFFVGLFIYTYIASISYLLFFPRKWPNWRPDYKSSVLNFPNSKFHLKCPFFIVVIAICYFEIFHFVTITKWQYQKYLWIISDGTLTSNPHINVLFFAFLWSTAVLGILSATYAFSCILLKKECTVNRIKNRYFTWMFFPLLVHSMTYVLIDRSTLST